MAGQETPQTILVVDDEARYVRWISLNLEGAGYKVLSAADGLTAVQQAAAVPLDLILLDLNLPVLDGFAACSRIREFSDVPIIMLTAKAEEQDKVRGLDVGADDYLVKPFGPPELLARVRAVLRRVPRGSAPPVPSMPRFTVGDLEIDFSQHLVKRHGQPVDLSPTEYRLLAHLARHAGKVVVSDALLNAVWGPEYRDELQHVRLYVSRVRRKIEDDPEHPRYVLTRPGIGYMLVSEAAETVSGSS